MADIDVVKKSSRAWIWWIVALVVAFLLIWMLMMGADTGTTQRPISEAIIDGVQPRIAAVYT